MASSGPSLHSDQQIVLLTMPGLPPTPGHPCPTQHRGGDHTVRPASDVPGLLPHPIQMLQGLPAGTTLSGPLGCTGKDPGLLRDAALLPGASFKCPPLF